MIAGSLAALAGSGWLRWLEETALAVSLRRSAWGYPAVETAHILGLTMLVGAAALFDLRLLGLARSVSVARAAEYLLRCSRWSLLMVVPTGLLLFMTQATETWANPAFRLKLLLLVLAGLNALLFQLRQSPSALEGWNSERETPRSAKFSAMISLLCWTGVITCGRLIAYL